MTTLPLFRDQWRWRHLFGEASARFSTCTIHHERGDQCECDDNPYRYTLTRTWNLESPPLVVVACNPSKASASRSDHTMTKLVNFADRWGHGGLILLNCYAYRATDPADLRRAERSGTPVIGPDNDLTIRRTLDEHRASKLLLAWGMNVPSDRARAVARIAIDVHGRPECLGLTEGADPQPRHPLLVPYITTPRLYVELMAERSNR